MKAFPSRYCTVERHQHQINCSKILLMSSLISKEKRPTQSPPHFFLLDFHPLAFFFGDSTQPLCQSSARWLEDLLFFKILHEFVLYIQM